LDTNTNLYIEGIHSYLDNSLAIKYTYVFEREGFFARPELSVNGEFSYRYYPGKLAKDENGNYGAVPANQADNAYGAGVSVLGWFGTHWNWKTSFDYQSFQSNNKDESYSASNFNFATLRSTAQFSY
jgi:hypothetical protein